MLGDFTYTRFASRRLASVTPTLAGVNPTTGFGINETYTYDSAGRDGELQRWNSRSSVLSNLFMVPGVAPLLVAVAGSGVFSPSRDEWYFELVTRWAWRRLVGTGLVGSTGAWPTPESPTGAWPPPEPANGSAPGPD